jgi:hypothetical protein
MEGIPTPWGIQRTTSLSPVSTGPEIVNAAIGRDFRTVADYAHPLGSAIYGIASRTVSGPNGPYRVDYPTAIKKNLERIVPDVNFVRDLINPDEDDPNYPEDASRWGRIKRELGVVPIEVNRTETGGSRTLDSVKGARQAYYDAILKTGTKLPKGKLPPDLKEALDRDAKRYANYASRGVTSSLEKEEWQRQAYIADLRLLRKWGEVGAADVKNELAWAKTASYKDLKSERRSLGDSFFGSKVRANYTKWLHENGAPDFEPKSISVP